MSPIKRRDKIKFLEGLRNGSRSLEELQADDGIVIAFQSHDDPGLFECRGELMTAEQIRERFSHRPKFMLPGSQIIFFKHEVVDRPR